MHCSNLRLGPPALLLALLASSCASAPDALPEDAPAVRLDDDGLAIDGFDPVAYFDGGEARPGSPAITAEHAGATWRFANAEHRALFLADPEHYSPSFGGWCAWAMAEEGGFLVDVEPRSFLVQDGRLLLFFDGILTDTRALWLEGDRAALLDQADANWSRMLAEHGAGAH